MSAGPISADSGRPIRRQNGRFCESILPIDYAGSACSGSSMVASRLSPFAEGGASVHTPANMPAGGTAKPKGGLTVSLPVHLTGRVRNAVFWTPGLTMACLAEIAFGRHSPAGSSSGGDPTRLGTGTSEPLADSVNDRGRYASLMTCYPGLAGIGIGANTTSRMRLRTGKNRQSAST